MTAAVPLSERLNALLGDDPAAMLAYYRKTLARYKKAMKAAAQLTAWFDAHGNNASMYESDRKARLSALRHKFRQEPPPAGMKAWTEGALDDAAHRDLDYLDYLKRETAEREKWEKLKAETEHLEGVLKYLDHRLHLVRSSLFFLGQEANLER